MFGISAQAQMQVKLSDDTLSISDMVSKYFTGYGIRQVKNIAYRGDTQSIGIFHEPTGKLGISDGIVLSTGLAEQAAGPNGRPNAGANLEGFFFTDEHLTGTSNMCDGVVLEFDFIPMHDSITFDFIFGSDEYPEFVGKEFNDLFGFYFWEVSAKHNKPVNLGVLPNKQVINVNNVNHKKNSEWYQPNNVHTNPAFDIVEWDGLTKKIATGARVIPYRIYHLKFVIADLSDCEYDSGVLLRMHSLRSIPRKRIPVRKNYYFNFAHAEASLTETDLKRLNRLKDSIALLNLDSIVIIGHTDSVGNEKFNHELSVKRALAVGKVLQVNSTTTFVTRGMGSKKPIANNKTAKGKATNRRVELLFYRKYE